MRAAQPLIFLCVDIPHGLFGGPARLIQAQVPAHSLNQAELIVTIQYLKILRQAGVLPVCLQQPMSEAMKGTNPHTVGWDLQHFLYTTAHFPGRFIGKGHCQN